MLYPKLKANRIIHTFLRLSQKQEHSGGHSIKKKQILPQRRCGSICFQSSTLVLHQECCNECKDGVELGESCVNHGVCLHVVTL